MFEGLGRSVAARYAHVLCIGTLAASLVGCSEKEPSIPLPDCFKTAQFGERSFVTNIPDAPEHMSGTDLQAGKPDISSATAQALQKASMQVTYDPEGRPRTTTGFFVQDSKGNLYAVTAAHAFRGKNPNLVKTLIETYDGYRMIPSGGCKMAEHKGSKVDPFQNPGGSVDLAIMKISIPDDAARKYITPLKLAVEPPPINSWVVVRTTDDTFPAKTQTADGTHILTGIPNQALYHHLEYSIDPGDSGSLVASVGRKGSIAVQGLVTSVADYKGTNVHAPGYPLQTARVTPAAAINKAIEGLNKQ